MVDDQEEFSRIDNVANSKNLWHRLKEKQEKSRILLIYFFSKKIN